MTSTTHIERNALLVSLHVRRWTARKTDKNASNDLTSDAGAEAGVARVTKDLIDRTKIKAITGVYDEAYRTLQASTLPWSDDGRRLLPADMMLSLQHKMQVMERRFWDAVEDLQNSYADEREHARQTLGTLFNYDDYPPAATIPSKFGFGWAFEPVPVSADIRVNLPESLRDQMASDIDNRVKDRLKEATDACFERVATTLRRMHSIVSADKPRIHDSLMRDMHQLVEILPSLNLTNDPVLAKLAVDMRNMFYGLDTESLRKDADMRAQAARDSESVLNALEGLL
jgi:hypothetical protein